MAPIDWPMGFVGAGARPDSGNTFPAESWGVWPALTAVAVADRGGRGLAGALTAAAGAGAGALHRGYGLRRRDRGGAQRGKVCCSFLLYAGGFLLELHVAFPCFSNCDALRSTRLNHVLWNCWKTTKSRPADEPVVPQLV